MEVRVDVGEDCRALRIGISEVTGPGMRHTNTGDSPAARDNSPAVPSVPWVVYPAMGIDGSILLFLEGC